MVRDFLILRTSLYVVGGLLASGLIHLGVWIEPLNGIEHPWLDDLAGLLQASGGMLRNWLFPNYGQHPSQQLW